MKTYSVRSGDTLSALAKRFGTTVSALAKTNHISNPSRINVGQKLSIPDGFDGPASKPTTKPSSKPSSSGTSSGTSSSASTGSAGPVKDSTGRQYPTSKDGTPMFRQGDPAWGSRVLGRNYSVSAAGCAMTSTAMAISKISGKAINPGQLDQYLDKHGGYSGDGLMWGTAAKAAGLGASKAAWSLGTLNKQIDAGRPVVVGVDYKAGSGGGGNGTDHWITVTGRGKENGKDVYFANDPATGKQITLHPEGNRLVGGPKNYKTTGELVTFSGGKANLPTASSGGSKPSGGTGGASGTGGTSSTPSKASGDLKGMTLPAKDLEKGARGPEVEQLQKALVKLGHMTQAQMNTGPGIFGPKTESALKEFQAAHGVDAIGRYGPKTRAAFEKLGAKVGGSGSPSEPSGPTGPGPTGPVGELPKTGNAFIDKVAADAIRSQRETGVPASVTLAQAMLESGSGKSGLSTKANNFFGIKGEGPAGHVTMPTKEYLNGKWVTVDANFRKYHTPAESFTDHGKFLRNNKRYANAFKYTDNAEQFAREIHKAGYATDPQYSNKLISIIQRYGLERFDKLGRN